MEKREYQAKTVELAVENGLKDLGITMEEAVVEVLEQGGFLRKAKVSIYKKQTEGEIARDFVENLAEKMNFDCVVELDDKDDCALINIESTDSGSFIGRRGDVLDAIQYLASLVSNREKEDFRRIVVDCENYRDKREETLKKLAINLSKKVSKTGKAVELEPMNPYERRLIHSALQNNAYVYTKSKGEDPDRKVIIIPKKKRDFNRDRNKNYHKDRNQVRKSAPRTKFVGFGTYLGKAESTEEN